MIITGGRRDTTLQADQLDWFRRLSCRSGASRVRPWTRRNRNKVRNSSLFNSQAEYFCWMSKKFTTLRIGHSISVLWNVLPCINWSNIDFSRTMNNSLSISSTFHFLFVSLLLSPNTCKSLCFLSPLFIFVWNTDELPQQIFVIPLLLLSNHQHEEERK